MANRERGEMTLKTSESYMDDDGVMQTRPKNYTLRLTTNACCDLEDRSGKLFDDVVRGVNRGSVRDLRWMLWASLQACHADTVKDPQDVGAIIDDAGGLQGVASQLVGLMSLNQDDSGDKADAKGAGSANPPDAQAPIGDGSTSTLVATA